MTHKHCVIFYNRVETNTRQNCEFPSYLAPFFPRIWRGVCRTIDLPHFLSAVLPSGALKIGPFHNAHAVSGPFTTCAEARAYIDKCALRFALGGDIGSAFARNGGRFPITFFLEMVRKTKE
jgi:hypothetical protein